MSVLIVTLFIGLICYDPERYVRDRHKEINYYRSLTLALKRCECPTVMDRDIPR